jgi:signal transduction histidine kinase
MADELEAIHRDLARQVEARTAELLRSKRLASVGYLAAGVAHEINNPLGIISGYGERSLRDLQRRDLTADTAGRIEQSLRIVCEEAFRCKAITEQLLALARPRAAATHRPTDLARGAEQVAAAVRGLDTLGGRELRTLTRPGDDCTVLADPGELHQVLLNLVVNAVDATDPATGQIRLELARTDSGVTLTVTDNGRGIPADALPLLFEPFYTHRPADAPTRGTGLGLTIARAITEDLGGTLTAHSAGPDHGSTFTLRLPVTATREGEAPSEPPVPPAPAATQESSDSTNAH